MRAKLRTGCGCERFISIPDPPLREIRVPIMKAFSFGVFKEADIHDVAFPVRTFVLAAYEDPFYVYKENVDATLTDKEKEEIWRQATKFYLDRERKIEEERDAMASFAFGQNLFTFDLERSIETAGKSLETMKAALASIHKKKK